MLGVDKEQGPKEMLLCEHGVTHTVSSENIGVKPPYQWTKLRDN